MSKKITIVTTQNLAKVQGATEAHYLANYLPSNHEVHIYSTSDPQIDGVTFHPLPRSRFLPSLVLNFIALPLLLYHAKKLELDTIYTYRGFHFCPLVVSVLCRTNWVVDLQTKPTAQGKEWMDYLNYSNKVIGIYFRIDDFLYKLSLPNADEIITISESVRGHLTYKYGVDESKIHVIPLGVDIDLFKAEKSDWVHWQEPLDIVYVGKIAPQRELEICIDVLSSSATVFDIKIHFVGDGPADYIQDLKRKAHSEGVRDDFVYHGYVEHSRLPEFLRRMDVAISPLPPLDSYDVSSPAKVFEYLAMGLPVLSSNILAHRRVLKSRRCSFFFEPRDPDSLIAAINRLDDIDPETWRTIRQEARQIAIDNSWADRMGKIEDVIYN